MDVKAINSAIISGNFTNNELSSILDAVKFARSKVARVNAVTLHAGDTVKITHAKLGGTVVGTIKKIKIKKADVFIPGMNMTYNVPLSMLTAA